MERPQTYLPLGMQPFVCDDATCLTVCCGSENKGSCAYASTTSNRLKTTAVPLSPTS
jgi:hypothetical protein